MRMHHFFLLATLAGTALLAQPAAAEPLWAKLVPGKGVEADPSKDYHMSEQNGPWMIMATTFSGEGAEQQARELVLELRTRYKMEAYVHEKKWDFTKTFQGRGVDRNGEPPVMQYSRRMEIHDIAVLIGNFPSFEDPEAARTLDKIKYMKPNTLDKERRGKTNQNLTNLRQIQQMLLPEGHADKQKGPMAKAFITRNPLLPKEYFVQSGFDELVLQMNSQVKFSLLDCPGKYTLKVATFTGKTVLDQREVQAYEEGTKKLESRLVLAAEKAEDLTLALRQKGYEAYSYHDRHSSMVTIGSFDSVGTPRTDGKTEINPQIYDLMQRFSASENTANDGIPDDKGTHKLKSLIGIPFDIQPQIVHVPRPELSKQLGQARR